MHFFFFWHCSSSLSELDSKILMSKITPAYNGLTAVMVVLVTESTLGQVPLVGSSHVLGYCFLWLILKTLGRRYRQSPRSLETSSGEQSPSCYNIRRNVGIIKCYVDDLTMTKWAQLSFESTGPCTVALSINHKGNLMELTTSYCNVCLDVFGCQIELK